MQEKNMNGKRAILSSLIILFGMTAQAQHVTWPHQLGENERNYVERIGFAPPTVRGIETPPPFDSLRTAAEWEEVEALTISWTSFPCIQKQIVAASKEECTVLIFAEDIDEVESYLTGSVCGGAMDLENVQIVPAEYNSIWIRDYGANTVYGSWDDDRVLVDWMYNRPRPDDDAIPDLLGETMGIEVYSTTASPNDLMNTGGNWMSDGFGTAFASELILEENDGGSTWWTDFPDHSEAEVDQIIADFHGVNTYIKMPTLPYDGIHHIDMHMKLLDESTLLVAEYPMGVADGPQINANMEYVLSNFTTRWGTPFNVIRIPSPPEQGWGYPDQNGWYLTYTNSVFVNNTILLPTYYTQYDTTAIRIYEEALPGYEIVGIDCDNSGSAIISLSGAIHCITHTVGIEDPLMISHLPLPDTEDDQNDYIVEAYLSHRSGVAEAMLHWKEETSPDWNNATMAPVDDEGNWSASIPAQPQGTTIVYFVEATANSGKNGTRPMPAPEGWWSFDIIDPTAQINGLSGEIRFEVFPNPANAITCIPIEFLHTTEGTLELYNAWGKLSETIHSGTFPSGESKYFFNAEPLAPGAYVLMLRTDDGGHWTRNLIIQ
ncbi:MAG: agmatine deiminase family protein [Flavobacteriales bacterium]